ncbi:hypothetical protein BDV41DRAFT_526887 [Aspergillus transmontanensis]|uniref:Uncharacterized protein n=1 Tax=Aspergillus transmontanensis TaxID=1034304 RepID=A0A5N6WBE3_9EURO|nr:hypothetical protein BDV41DRAFT_526887 [Aspergillus transmontanensis]
MDRENAVIGVTEEDLNYIIKELFPLFPRFHTIGPVETPFTSAKVSLTIYEPPIVNIHEKCSSDAQLYRREKNSGEFNGTSIQLHDRDPALQSPHVEVSNIEFNLRILRCTLSFVHDQPNQPKSQIPTSRSWRCALNLIASLKVHASQTTPSLIVVIHNGKLITTGCEDDSITNGVVVPVLIDYINKEILRPFPIPSVPILKKLNLCVTHISSQNHQLIVSSSTGKTTPRASLPMGDWPGGAFIGVNAALLTAAANLITQEISETEPEDAFKFLNCESNGRTKLGPVSQVRFMDSGLGNVAARIAISYVTHTTLRMPWALPDITVKFCFDGEADITISVTIEDEKLSVGVRNVNDLVLGVRIDGMPDLLSDLLDMIAEVQCTLYKHASNFIFELLSDWQFSVAALSTPQLPRLKKDDPPLTIQLNDVQISPLDIGENTWLIASGTPNISTEG